EPTWPTVLQLAAADATSGVLVTNNGELFAFDYARGVAGDRVGGRVGNVGTIAFSPDRTRLVVPTGPTVRVYDWPQGRLLRSFTGHTGAVTVVAFGPDGKTLATGSDDTTVLLWDMAAPADAKEPPVLSPGGDAVLYQYVERYKK
ncbi:MAG TPA: hypothetical protein VH092_17135, partial [Urbifossiella sp.]|nr:hypothetical protein [Urbifossiella sp.]